MFTEVPPAAPSPQSVGKPVPGNRDSGLWFVLTLFKPQRSPGPGVQLPENRDGHVGHRQDVPVEPDPSAIGYLAPSFEQLRLALGTSWLVSGLPVHGEDSPSATFFVPSPGIGRPAVGAEGRGMPRCLTSRSVVMDNPTPEGEPP